LYPEPRRLVEAVEVRPEEGDLPVLLLDAVESRPGGTELGSFLHSPGRPDKPMLHDLQPPG
jgi:hypothetical protein